MKFTYTLSAILLCTSLGLAQKFKASDGTASFYSDAPMEDIEAVSESVNSIIDLEKKELAFLIPINSFQFDKKLMQEHFNENYMESEKYPNASFKGSLIGYNSGTRATQNVKAKGEMTIHGVKRNISVDGTLETKGEKLILKSKFQISVADYDVEIPQVVFYNIAETVDVTLELTYEQL